MAQPTKGRVEVGTRGERVLFRVTGRATHLVSQPVRDFARRMVQVGYRRFEVDLARCIHVDSTFAGVLALISLKLKDAGGTLSLINTPPSAQELLTSLGIDRLFDGPAPAPEPDDAPVAVSRMQSLPLTARSLEAWAGTVIEAHQMLVEADDRNEPRFRDLLEFLSEDLSSAPPVIPTHLPDQRTRRWKH